MKTHLKAFAFFSAIGLSFAGCGLEENEKKSILPGESMHVVSRDSMEKMMVETLYEINENLETIQLRERKIAFVGQDIVEKSASPKEKILRNIRLINTMMDENNRKIEELQMQLTGASVNNERLQRIVDETKNRLRAREAEVNDLKRTLEQREYTLEELSGKLSTLEMKYESLALLSEEYQNELNTGYYTIGTFKELKEHGVLTKEGGVWFLGETMLLKDDFSEDYFSKIDIEKVTKIPLHTKDAELITQHPPSSYAFEEREDAVASLQIKNPDEFWKASKYMVLRVK